MHYSVDLFADSVATFTFRRDSELRSVSLPTDLISQIHYHNLALTGDLERNETQLFISPSRGSVWFRLSRGFNIWLLVAATVLAVGALIVVVVRASTRSLRRERNELEASRIRMFRAREVERSHLASELHDGPIQELQRVLRAYLRPLSSELPRDRQIELQDVEGGLENVASSLRNICTDLRPPVLVHFGLEKAIAAWARDFAERNPSIDLRLELELGPDELPTDTRLTLYRVFQEAMNNVEKHAAAGTALVRLESLRDSLRMTVKDDGAGFDRPRRATALEESGHYGLSGMTQRARSLDGELEIDSSPGRGTTISVQVPISSAQPAEVS